MIMSSSLFPFRTQLRGYGRRYGDSGTDWMNFSPNYSDPNDPIYTSQASADTPSGGAFPMQTYPTIDGRPPVMQGSTAGTSQSSSPSGNFFTSFITGIASAFSPPSTNPTSQGTSPVLNPAQVAALNQQQNAMLLAQKSAAMPTWLFPVAGVVAAGALLYFVARQK